MLVLFADGIFDSISGWLFALSVGGTNHVGTLSNAP